ncbi:hypothetical protein FXN63_10260 [Pigmentiphaga aceris]|uniref:Uncharacterized protein n=1 Tax=Pigmentiphaga aceris TaxID=1940612 RepID=A0A5C0AV08_9BURK|nr:hypothetical protein [Pigmentiphaga aceris]QEI06178.1 hypothetical protein FXN63_10260 [Pigmentiphaga aceris]
MSSEIAAGQASAAHAVNLSTSVQVRGGSRALRARIVCAVLALGGSVLLAPAFAQDLPTTWNSVPEAKATSEAVTARISELDARYDADEAACMKTFFANACANRAREAYMKQKADLQRIKQGAELYQRVDADNQRRARVAANLAEAKEDLARRQSAAPTEPKAPKPQKTPTPPSKPSATPSAPVGEPGSSPLTDLGPMPTLPTESRQPAPLVRTPPAPKPDDSAQRAANRETFERKTEEARRYAEQHEPRAAKAAADRERRRAAREAEAKRLEGNAPPAGPAVVAPAGSTR